MGISYFIAKKGLNKNPPTTRNFVCSFLVACQHCRLWGAKHSIFFKIWLWRSADQL